MNAEKWLRLGNLPSYYEALSDLYEQKSKNEKLHEDTRAEHRGASRGYKVAASTLRDLLGVSKMTRTP